MSKPKERKRRRVSRIDRIERKCDRILSELILLRHRQSATDDMDTVIDRMHHAARRMLWQCENEYEACKRSSYNS